MLIPAVTSRPWALARSNAGSACTVDIWSAWYLAPVISTIAKSRSKPKRSAIVETAGIARSDANFPDVADAPLDRLGSCGCPIINAPS